MSMLSCNHLLDAHLLRCQQWTSSYSRLFEDTHFYYQTKCIHYLNYFDPLFVSTLYSWWFFKYLHFTPDVSLSIYILFLMNTVYYFPEWDVTYFKIGRPTRVKSLLPTSITYNNKETSQAHQIRTFPHVFQKQQLRKQYVTELGFLQSILLNKP